MKINLLCSLLFLLFSAFQADANNFLEDIKQAISEKAYDKADQLIQQQLQRKHTLSGHQQAALWHYRGLLNSRRFSAVMQNWSKDIPLPKFHLNNAILALEKSCLFAPHPYTKHSLQALDELYQLLQHLCVQAWQEEEFEQFYQFARHASHCNLFVFKQAPNIYEWSRPVLLFAAHGAELTGRYDEAINWYLRMIDLGADQIHLFTNVSRLYMRQGDFMHAINMLNYGLLRHPEAIELLQLKGELNSRLQPKKPVNASCKYPLMPRPSTSQA